MILVDTSIWISHISYRDGILSELLEADQVLMHPFVIGEVSLGQFRNRHAVLKALTDLPEAMLASDSEVTRLIEEQPLFGRGIGYVDAHLLASARITPRGRLWTRDKRLRGLAEELRIVAAIKDH